MGNRHKEVASRGGNDYGARMRIAIASDHAALDLKTELRDWLIEQGHEVADLGPEAADSVDYPDFGYKLASVVADGTAERGVAHRERCGGARDEWNPTQVDRCDEAREVG